MFIILFLKHREYLAKLDVLKFYIVLLIPRLGLFLVCSYFLVKKECMVKLSNMSPYYEQIREFGRIPHQRDADTSPELMFVR